MKLTGKVAGDGLKETGKRSAVASRHDVPRIWVMVADRHKVRIFNKTDGHLEEIGTATPSLQGRAKGVPNHSLGRVSSSASGAVRHKLQPHATPEEKESQSFAHDIAAWLDEAVRADAFDRLVLAAAPHMLGDLRKALSKPVHARVVAEVDKDLTKMGGEKLREELGKIVWF